MPNNNESWNNIWAAASPAANANTETNITLADRFISLISLESLQGVYVFFWLSFAILSLILFIILQVLKHKLKEQRKREQLFFASQERSEIAKRLYKEESLKKENKKFTKQWARIKSMFQSNEYSNKKMAILEADLLLKELLLDLGFPNEALGKMLRNISKEEFVFLEEAWQAHKIRNELAHSSLNSSVSESEIIEAMRIYERIFRHFDFI